MRKNQTTVMTQLYSLLRDFYKNMQIRKKKEAKLRKYLALIIYSVIVITNNELNAANLDRMDQPNYLTIVKAYANAMIEQGRDSYGTEYSPLFAAALDRETMKIASKEDFGSIPGIRENDRSLGGANPLSDIGLYEILYKLTELTGDKVYAGEADKALTYFFTHCQSPNTGLMAWGEHLYWDFNNEACGHVSKTDDFHEAGVWPFWDQCYEFAPEACWKFAIGEWDHQIADKTTGDFSRHARWSVHGPHTGADFPRYAGQMIERWADAYGREENFNRERREELITAITVILKRMEDNMKGTNSGYLPALKGADYVWPTSNIELARCLMESAPKMNTELAERMRKLALQQDIDFLKAPHCLASGGGFAVTLHAETGEPRSRSMNKPYTSTWETGYGYGTHAGTANQCYLRYCQLIPEYPDLAAQYKELILAAADQYLTSSPDTGQLLEPGAFADVIALMLSCHELSGDKKYLDRADYFGQLGINVFLNDGLPLPKATNMNKHYEAITGGPDFMNKLLELYMALNKAKIAR